jgi:hypothetical protein
LPGGGNFDGDLGSLSSVQILAHPDDLRIETRRSPHGRRVGLRRSISFRNSFDEMPRCGVFSKPDELNQGFTRLTKAESSGALAETHAPEQARIVKGSISLSGTSY